MKRYLIIFFIINFTFALIGCVKTAENEVPATPELFYPIHIILPLDDYVPDVTPEPGLPIEVYSDYPFDIKCETTGQLSISADGVVTVLDNLIESAESTIYYWTPNLSELVDTSDSESESESELVCIVQFYNQTQIIELGIYLSTEGIYRADFVVEEEF